MIDTELGAMSRVKHEYAYINTLIGKIEKGMSHIEDTLKLTTMERSVADSDEETEAEKNDKREIVNEARSQIEAIIKAAY